MPIEKLTINEDSNLDLRLKINELIDSQNRMEEAVIYIAGWKNEIDWKFLIKILEGK